MRSIYTITLIILIVILIQQLNERKIQRIEPPPEKQLSETDLETACLSLWATEQNKKWYAKEQQ